MDIVHIKLNNGDDLIGRKIEHDREGEYHIEDPIKIKFDPQCGIIAQSWLILSEKDSVIFEDKDIMLIGHANQRGAEYYKAFFEEKDESDDYVEYNLEGKTELDREREEMIISYLESKGEVKH